MRLNYSFPLLVGLLLVGALLIASPSIGLSQGKPPVFIEGPHGTVIDSAAKTFKDDAARITNLRRHEMRSISGHYRSLEAVIRYGAPIKASMNAHADALLGLAGNIPNVFVPGTEMSPDKWGAKSSIWSDPKKFEKHYQGFQQSVVNLKSSISGGDATDMNEKLLLIRHECLACHKEFRVRRRR